MRCFIMFINCLNCINCHDNYVIYFYFVNLLNLIFTKKKKKKKHLYSGTNYNLVVNVFVRFKKQLLIFISIYLVINISNFMKNFVKC